MYVSLASSDMHIEFNPNLKPLTLKANELTINSGQIKLSLP